MSDAKKVPIDIQYQKLLGALIDRRIVPQKWLEQQRKIRDTIAILYPDLPPKTPELAKLINKKTKHEDIQYFDCKYIVESLLSTQEGQEKNFFGQYTAPLMKNWNALVKAYERNNLFAAECARIIAQNTAYEIPFLKKTIQQNEKAVGENNRKIVELRKSISEYKRRLSDACSNMGIEGNNFREELERLPRELPSIFSNVSASICSETIQEAIAYHQALQTYLHSCDPPSAPSATTNNSKNTSSRKKKAGKKAATSSALEESQVEESIDQKSTSRPSSVPTFFHAIAELRAAEDVHPTQVEQDSVGVDLSSDDAEINWDISLEDTGAVVSMDEEGVVSSIDWGIETASVETATNVEEDASPVEIDWDISTDNVGIVDTTADISTPVIANAFSANPNDSTSLDKSTRIGLLMDTEIRNRVLNDLLELRAFLRQRTQELLAEDNVAFANHFQGTCSLLEQQSFGTIKTFHAKVQEAIDLLTDKRLQQLLLIQSSERFLNRQVSSLDMLVKHINKNTREIKVLEDKNMDLIDATAKLLPQIDTLVTATKKLKKDLEASLPALFKGYKVNIIGEVNSL